MKLPAPTYIRNRRYWQLNDVRQAAGLSPLPEEKNVLVAAAKAREILGGISDMTLHRWTQGDPRRQERDYRLQADSLRQARG